jgi:hypothetical protein
LSRVSCWGRIQCPKCTYTDAPFPVFYFCIFFEMIDCGARIVVHYLTKFSVSEEFSELFGSRLSDIKSGTTVNALACTTGTQWSSNHVSLFFFFWFTWVSRSAYAHHDYSPRSTGHPASPGAGKAPRGWQACT